MILSDFLNCLVLALTVVVIARWRGVGAILSILFGWAAIWYILSSFPTADAEKWEDCEAWACCGWLLMAIWSGLVYGIVSLRSLIAGRRQSHA
jgi:hypothetical protein